MPPFFVPASTFGVNTGVQNAYFRRGNSTFHPLKGLPTTSASGNRAANELIIVPFFEGRGATIDAILYQPTVAAGNQIRFGIYTNKSLVDCYPDQLLFDSGIQVPAGVGNQILLLATPLVLTPNSLFWITGVSNGLGSYAVFAGNTLAVQEAIIGLPSPPASNLNAAQDVWFLTIAAFGLATVLPQTFPAGAVAGVGPSSVFDIRLRYK